MLLEDKNALVTGGSQGIGAATALELARQVAMALAKELTSYSLPEIGEWFGGRDHTTVLHACRKINELKESDLRIAEDYSNLCRILTT